MELNDRMRDFYDRYLIYIKDWNNINLDHFRKAIVKTFTKRNSNLNLLELLINIKDSDLLKNKWNIYKRKYEYVKEIEFEQILDCLEKIIEQVELVVVNS